jgi:PhnB protein
MKEVVTFLNFDGNCREAMQFYKQCFDAELFLLPYGDAPGDPAWQAPEVKDRIIHSGLIKGPLTILMAADVMPGAAARQRNGFGVGIQCESPAEIDALFAALAEGGTVTMPLQETFWATRFGMLTDRFGICWMLNLGKPQPE